MDSDGDPSLDRWLWMVSGLGQRERSVVKSGAATQEVTMNDGSIMILGKNLSKSKKAN